MFEDLGLGSETERAALRRLARSEEQPEPPQTSPEGYADNDTNQTLESGDGIVA